MRRLTGILLIVFLGFHSCSKDQEKDQVGLKKCTIDYELKEEVNQVKLVFEHLYLPVEMSNIFNDIGEEFDPTLLRNPDEVEKIFFSNEIALAMGIFGVNLGYVRLFNQWGMANLYFQSLKILSSKIGISEQVFNDLSKYFDHPVNSKDTLEFLANQVYILTDYNLRQNGRDQASMLIILGGWLEAMKISLSLFNENNNKVILQKICDQVNSLNSVINLLSTIENDELLTNYLDQLYELQNLFRGLNAAYKHYTGKVTDQYSNDTIINYLIKIEKIVGRMLNFAV